MVKFPPKGPWDDLRREIEEILSLPCSSTDPKRKFNWELLSPFNLTKELKVKLEDFLRRMN